MNRVATLPRRSSITRLTRVVPVRSFGPYLICTPPRSCPFIESVHQSKLNASGLSG